MKITTLFVAITALGLTSASPVAVAERSTKEATLRFLTYNVRYDSQRNDISVQQTLDSLNSGLPVKPSPFYGNSSERAWSQRRIGVSNEILWPKVDVFGVQEVLTRQVNDLQELLGDKWDHIGVGRDDGKEAGEYSAIFFKKSSMRLVSWDTFWLSNTPFEPSKYPGAGSFRACTRARFRSEAGVFTLLNAHLDDQSDVQRKLAASLMLHRAKFEAIKTGRPVFLVGDFNSPTEGVDGGAYQIASGALAPLPINATFAEKYKWSEREENEFKLKDFAGAAPPRSRSGNYATYTGFAGVGDTNRYVRIDYMFGGSVNNDWTLENYHVGTSLYDNGSWNSDHRPVYSDITIRDN